MRCNAKLLAIDTSSVACTVAASNGDAVVERHVEQPREHTRLLMPMIREVLNESEIALTDLDAIVLGNGPGSFIGMRIAASVSQGLAHGAQDHSCIFSCCCSGGSSRRVGCRACGRRTRRAHE